MNAVHFCRVRATQLWLKYIQCAASSIHIHVHVRKHNTCNSVIHSPPLPSFVTFGSVGIAQFVIELGSTAFQDLSASTRSNIFSLVVTLQPLNFQWAGFTFACSARAEPSPCGSHMKYSVYMWGQNASLDTYMYIYIKLCQLSTRFAHSNSPITLKILFFCIV